MSTPSTHRRGEHEVNEGIQSQLTESAHPLSTELPTYFNSFISLEKSSDSPYTELSNGGGRERKQVHTHPHDHPEKNVDAANLILPENELSVINNLGSIFSSGNEKRDAQDDFVTFQHEAKVLKSSHISDSGSEFYVVAQVMQHPIAKSPTLHERPTDSQNNDDPLDLLLSPPKKPSSLSRLKKTIVTSKQRDGPTKSIKPRQTASSEHHQQEDVIIKTALEKTLNVKKVVQSEDPLSLLLGGNRPDNPSQQNKKDSDKRIG